MPDRLADLVERCLARHLEHRPHLREIERELRALASELPPRDPDGGPPGFEEGFDGTTRIRPEAGGAVD